MDAFVMERICIFLQEITSTHLCSKEEKNKNSKIIYQMKLFLLLTGLCAAIMEL